MNKITRLICFCLVVIISTAINYSSSAQTKSVRSTGPDPETTERLFSFWSLTLEQVSIEQSATKEEFGIFNRFNEQQIDAMQTAFSKGVWDGSINLSNVKDYVAARKTELNDLFVKFKKIETEFPTSIEEYKYKKRPRLSADSCFPVCYNTGFEDGTFDGWYGFYSVNNSTLTTFALTAPIGGYLGPVVKAAQDPNTGNTYQMRITSGVTLDPFLQAYSTYSMPEVSPYGGAHSVLLGDSTRNGQGVAILSQTFLVSSVSASITYQYALFLENPGVLNNHTYTQQPFFTVAVIDQLGDTIPGCGAYVQDALNGPNSPGFTGIYYPTDADTVYWHPWSTVNVPLKNYLGQCVTVIFTIQDCSLGGHFGYAYVDASCAPENVITSSPALCGQDSITLTAPPGWGRYLWSGNPTNGIISLDTLQTIYVDKPGTYTVLTTNFNGNQCSDTLVIKIDSAPGPVPKPSFTVNTVCAGQNITFNNTSNPIGGQFYWDFYNIGTYQDSLITNPTWVYSSPGTYVVKLHEVFNGCGADFYQTINVEPSVSGTYTFPNNLCVPATVTFTNGTVGATSYSWNFGDPLSNPNDTSTITVNGTHTYTTPGTYTVTLIASNGGPCPDTVKQVITIVGPPVAIITGGDSVCPGGVDTLTASGGTSYLWNTSATTSSITVSPLTQTVYSVTATNACGSSNTTFTVNINGLPIALLSTDKDSICSGDTVKLTAGGGGSYVWSTGATASMIRVVPAINTTYTLHVFTTSTTCQDSAVVTINVTPTIKSTVTLAPDSVCPGTPATLTVTSGGGPPIYIWNTGATTSTITVTPFTTTTYYVLTAGRCANDSIGQVVTVMPFPAPAIASSDTVCKGAAVILTASGATNYTWSNGSTTNPTTMNINNDSTITLIGTNGNCKDSTKKRIKIYTPLVSRFLSDTVCSGSKAIIEVSVSGGHGPYTYAWSNGITWDSAGPLSVTPPPYQYICTITDGCGNIINDTDNVIVRPAPAIAFYPTPDTIEGGAFVNFVNLTTGATGYYWNLGDGTTASDTTPFHEYNQAGVYVVTLIATNSFGCVDTLVKDVYVQEQIIVPNIFTPNGDGNNDVFHIVAGSMKVFDVQIFNRWGQKVFETNSPNIDWTGRSTSGVMESNGTYYYIIQATDYSGKNFNLDGYFELIR